MADVKKIIKDLGDTNWSKDNEAQMKAIQLLKGLATSDEDISNEFMKIIDKATTDAAKKVLDMSEAKKCKKKNEEEDEEEAEEEAEEEDEEEEDEGKTDKKKKVVKESFIDMVNKAL